MFWRCSGPKSSGSFIANYQYEAAGRRISKVTKVISAQGEEEVVFPHDGWNVIQEWEAQAATNLLAAIPPGFQDQKEAATRIGLRASWGPSREPHRRKFRSCSGGPFGTFRGSIRCRRRLYE